MGGGGEEEWGRGGRVGEGESGGRGGGESGSLGEEEGEQEGGSQVKCWWQPGPGPQTSSSICALPRAPGNQPPDFSVPGLHAHEAAGVGRHGISALPNPYVKTRHVPRGNSEARDVCCCSSDTDTMPAPTQRVRADT